MLETILFTFFFMSSQENDTLADYFLPPVRVEAAGSPIDTDVGHAAPFVADFNDDGVQDLLVGQFGGGLLRFYCNEGTHRDPKLAAGVKFMAGDKDGCVPSG
ncbi:MAG: hypothetical protein ABIK28_14075 [Planctomycetota bacterium]